MKLIGYSLTALLAGCLLALVTGCNLVPVTTTTAPTTQQTPQQAQLAALQNDLNLAVAGLNLGHAVGAFNTPSQWALVQTYEATAQTAINLAQAGIDATNSGQPVDLATLLNDAANAVATFERQASMGAGK